MRGATSLPTNDAPDPQQTSERQLVSPLLTRIALLSSGAFLVFAPRGVVA
jgi:hypothetical protein